MLSRCSPGDCIFVRCQLPGTSLDSAGSLMGDSLTLGEDCQQGFMVCLQLKMVPKQIRMEACHAYYTYQSLILNLWVLFFCFIQGPGYEPNRFFWTIRHQVWENCSNTICWSITCLRILRLGSKLASTCNDSNNCLDCSNDFLFSCSLPALILSEEFI